AAASDNFMRF
uniref:FMRFamide-6 n=1 Tax=Lucilia cuprina TaxID=7375 RepID=FAR6_LUCCU|nr:RecName: Full=FMRFamide-6; AltName: Full=LucFMRFamide-6 [Lucilia cuprina]